MQIIRSIQNRIYEIRGEKILFDFDLAAFMKKSTANWSQIVSSGHCGMAKPFMLRIPGRMC
jgi:hypothetical protein